MKSFIVSENNNNKKIVPVILDEYSGLSYNSLLKAFRKKDVKVNGTRVSSDYVVSTGDKIEIYLIDSFFEKPSLDIVYEDDNLIIVNKPQGVAVHPDSKTSSNTLIDNINEYLETKNESARLCHRIDRNTGGIVISAKNYEALSCIKEKLSSNEIHKHYICMVYGIMDKKADTLNAYLTKDSRKSHVYVNDQPEAHSLPITTKYTVVSEGENYSILDIELLTGRTHQIRAHMAHIGHPVIGDGKYGTNDINKEFKAKRQKLWAYKIDMLFKDDCYLSYLNGKTFKINPDL